MEYYTCKEYKIRDYKIIKYELVKSQNLPLSQRIVYSNGATIPLYGKLNSNLLANGNKQEIIHAYRNYLKTRGSKAKRVTIIATASVYSTYAKKWFDDVECMMTRKNCVYDNINNIYDYIKKRRNNMIYNDNIKNIKIDVKFHS